MEREHRVLRVQGVQAQSRTSKAKMSAQMFWGKLWCICLENLVGCCFVFLCQGSIPYAFSFTGCCVQGVLGCQGIWLLGDLCLQGTFCWFGSAQGFLLGSAGVQDACSGAVFSVSARHRLQIHVIVLKMQNARLSLYSVPCVP